MKKIMTLIFLSTLVACAPQGRRAFGSGGGPISFGPGVPGSSPSAIVAAELRLARQAQEEGQWTAFRQTATDDAHSFNPNLSRVSAWINDRDDPETAVTWQPYHVIISCDGSMATAQGAWKAANGDQGYYTTIWQQQNDGEYKWVFGHETAAQVKGDADAVTSQRAECGGRSAVRRPENPGQRRGKPASMPGIAVTQNGDGRQLTSRSRDGSLKWIAQERGDGNRTLTVSILDGGEHISVIDEQSKASVAGKVGE